MRKVILALCFVFMASVASAQDLAIWEGKDGTSGYYKEVKCEICGKLLREWVETSSSSGSWILTTQGDTISGWEITTKPQAPKPLEKVTRLNWNRSPRLCAHCKKKFSQELYDSLAQTYEKWLMKARLNSEDRSVKMQEQAKEYRLQALRKELADFKREMQEKIKQMEVQ